jgi:hypothetical protein
MPKRATERGGLCVVEERKMAQVANSGLRMTANGVKQPIGPEDPDLRAYHESLIAADYDCCHRDDSFEALKLRARFSKEDQGLLKEWMALAAVRAGRMERALEPVGPSSLAA